MRARRRFLHGLASLPFIGDGVTLIGQPTRAPVPCSDMLLDRYVAFLAHEHRAALIESELRKTAHPKMRDRIEAGNVPMFWFPDDLGARSMCEHIKPSGRAAVVLSAVGLPVFGAKL